MSTAGSDDRWSRWLGERRHGGDAEQRARMYSDLLIPLRDRVLDAAEPLAGSSVLDVGCGDGLISFGALDRGAGEVIFSDISADLLAECRRIAEGDDLRDRCRFVQASADDLGPVATGSVDAVTVRSVLIYVRDKRTCFAEFARVLRPGGRLSVFEPINRFGRPEWTGGRFAGIDVEPVRPLVDKLRDAYGPHIPEDDPMLDFDERDLFELAEGAGFHPVELTLEAEVKPGRAVRWDVYVNSAGNPNLPTLAEAMAEKLSGAERAMLTDYLRPIVESGGATRRMALAYLRAVRAEGG